MASWGVRFETKGGRINRVKGHGSVASCAAILTGGGGQMMRTLLGQMERAGTRIMNRVMITDLLTSDGNHPTNGHVVGALGFSPQGGVTMIPGRARTGKRSP